MSVKKVYNIRFASTWPMVNILQVLNGHGDVIAIVQDGEVDTAIPAKRVATVSVMPTRRRSMSEEQRLAKSELRRRAMEEHAERVLAALIPIMRDNQWASEDKIVALMNKSDVPVGYKGTPWHAKSLRRWIERATERLTAPADVMVEDLGKGEVR